MYTIPYHTKTYHTIRLQGVVVSEKVGVYVSADVWGGSVVKSIKSASTSPQQQVNILVGMA